MEPAGRGRDLSFFAREAIQCCAVKGIDANARLTNDLGNTALILAAYDGKAQIIGVIGILELLGEAAVKPHYMMGGTPGKIPLLWDPLGFTKKLSPETLARKRTAELKNG